MPVEARFWRAEGNRIRCRLCPNECLVVPGKSGRCLGRKNVEGTFYAVNYGECVSAAMDPIEKKPLYHFLPGSDILSVATFGCNLQCPFCQNWEISQRTAPTRFISPDELMELARRQSAVGVAFTYTEPLIWFEYLLDACPLLRKAGLKTVLVTNGMVCPEPLAELLPHIDAMNVDLKSVRPEFYRDYVKGNLPAVMNTIREAASACHLEVTNLLVPGRNDSEEEIHDLVEFVAEQGRGVPLHFSQYFPRYRATEPSTQVERLLRAAELGRRSLDYVYLGNVDAGSEYRDTRCPGCGNLLVDRSGYSGRLVGVSDGNCSACGRAADFVL